MNNPIPNAVRGLIIGTWLGGLLWFEIRRQLRPRHKNKLRRDVRNSVIAAPAAAVMQALEMPLSFGIATYCQQHRFGILPLLPLRPAVRAIVGVLMLDYTLYWWHFLTHRVAFLWRFHQVHHLDQEMDATTALRFHFGEITISLGYRALQIATIGASPIAVAAWQVFLFLSILFHHSDIRLPLAFERRLGRLLMTPRLHGIHHSIKADEVNSNWSSGLTVWDRLHGTLHTGVPQSVLTLGVPGFLEESDDGVLKSLALPFTKAAVPPPAIPPR